MYIKRSKPNSLHSQRPALISVCETHLSLFIAHFQCKRSFCYDFSAIAFDRFHFLFAMDISFGISLLLCAESTRFYWKISSKMPTQQNASLGTPAHYLSPIISYSRHTHTRTFICPHCFHAKITFYHSPRVLNYFSFNYFVHRKYISSAIYLVFSVSSHLYAILVAVVVTVDYFMLSYVFHCTEHRNAT